MSRIVISGYYGFDNTGDEAVLSVLLDMLSEKYGRESLSVMSANPARTARDHNVRTIDRGSFRLVTAAVKRCDMLVSGGGGLLQDITSNRSLYYYLGIIGLARLFGKKVVYFANGIGPIKNKFNRWLVGLASQKVTAISVRDPESAQELISVGVGADKIKITADPALLLRMADKSVLAEKLAGGGYDSSVGAVAVCPRNWKDYDAIAARLAELCDYVIENYGMQIILIPFHHEPDLLACKKIAELMHSKAIVVETRLTPEEIRTLIGSCQLTLGMRLHSLILSAAAGVPLAGIPYDKKVAQFLLQTGQPELPGFFAPSDVSCGEILERILHEKDNLKKQLETRLPDLIAKAKLNGQVFE